jgi:TolB-like protein/DNA-binding winged helix-turn-helix (wHTH) protein
MDRARSRGVVRFGLYEVELHSGQLRKSGIRIRLQEQPFQVLAVLLEHPGELITREELRREVWPADTFVEFDHALNTAIKKIRVALGDDAATPRYIETIPKRGYRWIIPIQAQAQVESVPNRLDEDAAVSQPRNFSSRWRFLIPLLAGLVLAAVLGFWLTGPGRTHPGKRVMLAVLPIENWSDDPAQAGRCGGLTEDLIGQLAAVAPSKIQVAPDATVRQYEHTPRAVSQIGHELGADFILQGNLRGTHERFRLSVELIRVRDQARLWGDSFDQTAGDPVEMEGDLARKVAASLGPVVLSSTR